MLVLTRICLTPISKLPVIVKSVIPYILERLLKINVGSSSNGMANKDYQKASLLQAATAAPSTAPLVWCVVVYGVACCDVW